MNNSLLPLSLDFNDIKNALKQYLNDQEEFTDYNFSGSALSVLLDVLAYNTSYNALLVSLAANESFLDTAIKRSSVVSLAKMLGYTPRSITSAVAVVTIVVTPSGNETSLTLNTTDTFSATVDNNIFTFRPKKSQVAVLQNGVFTFSNVELIEGVQLQNSFLATSDLISGPFVIPVDNVDTTTLSVWVQNSITDLGVNVYPQATTIVDVANTTKIYWIAETTGGQYHIWFGDDIIGQALTEGNVVNASYLVSSGSLANGAAVFSPTGAISGENIITVTTIESASGGNEKETIDQIRFNAPRFNTTKNRVVSEQDYVSLIMANLPKAKSVVVWGGENNNPPIYGIVFISIDPIQPYIVTDNDKNFLVDDVLKPRSVLGIQHQFVDPEYVYIGFNIRATYDASATNYTASQLSTLIQAAAQNYFSINLGTLDKTFYYSQFLDALEASNPAILGVLAQMRIQKRITGTSAFNSTKNLQFLSSLVPGSITSTAFVASINGNSYTVYMQDFSDSAIPSATGTGTIKLLKYGTGTVLATDVGTVDYASGVIDFSDLTIEQYLGNINDVRVQAVPQEWSKNISPSFVTLTESQTYAVLPQPARNVILKLDDSYIDQSIGLTAGMTVTSTPATET